MLKTLYEKYLIEKKCGKMLLEKMRIGEFKLLQEEWIYLLSTKVTKEKKIIKHGS